MCASAYQYLNGPLGGDDGFDPFSFDRKQILVEEETNTATHTHTREMECVEEAKESYSGNRNRVDRFRTIAKLDDAEQGAATSPEEEKACINFLSRQERSLSKHQETEDVVPYSFT